MKRRTRLALPLLLALSALAAGCGGDGGAGGLRERAERVVEDIRVAIDRANEQARERRAQDTGSVPGGAPGDREVLRTDTQTAFDYDEYQQMLESVIGSLDAYWREHLPRLGVEYRPPARYVYYRSDEGGGPSCGGEQAPPRNAFYCSAGDFIAWDESGLMIPYYVSAGDFAAAFVLAHEFGHAMQSRLPRQERLGVLRELQADCFAGAWAAAMQEQGRLEEGDLDEATLAVFSARDVPGTPFTDPQAHGSGFERTRAFTDGYENGPGACYPAPAEDWVVRR